jgi:hypothetical protein
MMTSTLTYIHTCDCYNEVGGIGHGLHFLEAKRRIQEILRALVRRAEENHPTLCMYACMHVCMYVCMYCMYVCI